MVRSLASPPTKGSATGSSRMPTGRAGRRVPRRVARTPYVARRREVQNAPMRTAAIILAAGASTRFGSPKQEVRLDGRRMVDIIAATAGAAGLDPVLAVVPVGFQVATGVVPVVNSEPEAGISRSLRLGVR